MQSVRPWEWRGTSPAPSTLSTQRDDSFDIVYKVRHSWTARPTLVAVSPDEPHSHGRFCKTKSVVKSLLKSAVKSKSKSKNEGKALVRDNDGNGVTAPAPAPAPCKHKLRSSCKKCKVNAPQPVAVEGSTDTASDRPLCSGFLCAAGGCPDCDVTIRDRMMWMARGSQGRRRPCHHHRAPSNDSEHEDPGNFDFGFGGVGQSEVKPFLGSQSRKEEKREGEQGKTTIMPVEPSSSGKTDGNAEGNAGGNVDDMTPDTARFSDLSNSTQTHESQGSSQARTPSLADTDNTSLSDSDSDDDLAQLAWNIHQFLSNIDHTGDSDADAEWSDTDDDYEKFYDAQQVQALVLIPVTPTTVTLHRAVDSQQTPPQTSTDSSPLENASQSSSQHTQGQSAAAQHRGSESPGDTTPTPTPILTHLLPKPLQPGRWLSNRNPTTLNNSNNMHFPSSILHPRQPHPPAPPLPFLHSRRDTPHFPLNALHTPWHRAASTFYAKNLLRSGCPTPGKLPSDILSGLVRAAVYGDSKAQEFLLRVHEDSQTRPLKYEPRELRTLRSGYLMLDLAILAVAGFTNGDVVHAVRTQLILSRRA